MELFAVICETCTARLKVRDMRAIGQILACPKCRGMVQIAPPPGWTPPSDATLAAHANDPITNTGSTIQFKQPVSAQEALANASAKRREKAATAAAAAALPAPPVAASSTTGSFTEPDFTGVASSESASSESAATASAASPVVEGARTAMASRAAAAVASRASSVGQSMAQNWIYWLCGPIAAIALVLVGWIVFQSTGSKTQVAAVDPSAHPASEPENAAAPPTQPGESETNADSGNPNAATPGPADPAIVPDDPNNTPQPALEQPAPDQPAADQPNDPAEPAAANDPPVEGADMPPGDDRRLPVDVQPRVPNAKAPIKVETPVLDDAMPDEAMPEPDADAPATDDAAAVPNEAVPVEGAIKVEKPVVDVKPGDDAADPDADATQPTVSSPIDIDARLADPLERVEFRRILLVDFCDFISELSTIPITLDVDALATAGVAPDEPLLQIKRTGTTVGELLTSVLAEHGLLYEIRGQQLLITGPQPGWIVSKYDVSDLTGAEAAESNKLVTLITRFVYPATWSAAGGKGTIEFSEGKLTVEQTPSVQRRVTQFLERLRVARGKTPKAAIPPKTKYARVKERFQKSAVTATYGIETPLVDVLEWLGRATRTRILIDGVSLEQVDRTIRSPVKMIAEKQTLDEILISLLDPLNLTFRIVDENTIQVYAKKPVGERYEFELHSISELLDRSNLEKILSVIREKIEPKSWAGAGGTGVIEYDPASKSLLVLQSPEVQIKLEKMLDKSRVGAAPAARKGP